MASGILEREGFVGRPSWEELRAGKTSSSSSHHRIWRMATWLAALRVFRFRTTLSGDRRTRQIMRRRPGSLAVLLWPRGWSSFLRFAHRARIPSATHAFPDTRVGEVTPSIALDRGHMRVRGQNDFFGRHRAACPQSGQLKRRAVPTERTLARVCREAGATVTRDVNLRDMNVEVSATDEERSKSWQLASRSTMGHSWPCTSHSGAQSLRSGHLGQPLPPSMEPH